jgi:nucleotide-binding universal stress UspA family protein
MYSHILIATDGSELAQRGLDQGLALAHKIGCKVVILNVTEMFPAYAARGEYSSIAVTQAIETHQKMGTEFAQKVLDTAAASAAKLNVECQTVHVAEMRPAEAILEVAKEKGCDLIVMASHGRRGVDRLFLGSQTIEVLAYSTVPVLVVR